MEPKPTEPPPAGLPAFSPRARRMAEENGVALSALAGRGTGPQGRVVEQDVADYLAQSAAPSGYTAPAPAAPLSARLERALPAETADLTTGLPGSRVRLPLPAASATLSPPPASSVLPVAALFALSVDVTDRVRPPNYFSPTEAIGEAIEAIRAADPAFPPVAVAEAGASALDWFVPALSPGQVCALGIGSTKETPVVRDGQIVIRTLLTLCLACDTSRFDTPSAARFLQQMKHRIETL